MLKPPHTQGLLLAKGPGIMKGYFNDEAATAKAFSAGNGWFNTGDLGWRAPSACLHKLPVAVTPASLLVLHLCSVLTLTALMLTAYRC